MPSSFIIAFCGVLIASILRGFTGFGFGLASVPLLSLALPPREVVPLVVTLQVIVSLASLRSAVPDCDGRALRRLLPGMLAGIPTGLLLLTTLPPNPVRLAIGGVILCSVFMIGRGLRLPPNPSWRVGGLIGFISGTISGLASMGGPPAIVYFLALGHSARRMRATAIVYFTLTSCVSLIPMTFRGLITRDILMWAVVSTPAMFIGTRLGTLGFQRTDARYHRIAALLLLSILATLLIARTLLR